jgi:hypothetical protein
MRRFFNKEMMALVCSLLFPVHAYAMAEGIKLTVCDVIIHPNDYVGKRVSFHARVEFDGIERLILVNDQEPGCGAIVPVSNPKTPRNRAAAKDLNHAIFSGNPGTLDRTIVADFTGVISIAKGEDFMLRPGKIPVMNFESVENIRVERIPLQEH